jgi:hypothetical protein
MKRDGSPVTLELASRLAMTEHFLCDALCEYARARHTKLLFDFSGFRAFANRFSTLSITSFIRSNEYYLSSLHQYIMVEGAIYHLAI